MTRPAPAPASIRSRRSFAALSESRERGRCGPVWVVRAPAESDEVRSAGEARVAVAYAVSRQVGTAVVRNRVRRRLRSLLREVADDLPPGRYLVGVRPDVVGLRFDQLRDRLARALGELR